MAGSQLNKQELKRSGSTLVYWLTGPEKAPLVVMTHGATIDHRTWNPQLKVLEDKYRVWLGTCAGTGSPSRSVMISPSRVQPRTWSPSWIN